MEKILTDLIQDLTQKMDIKINKLEIGKKDDSYYINLETEEPSLLIGPGGETIRAMQLILKILLWRKAQQEVNIFLDIDNYRKRQEESVITLAERKAALARTTGQDQALLPMSPYFRRLVHVHLSQPEFQDLTTESIGEGPHRKVIIKLKTEVGEKTPI